ncbi:hypothetical protein J1N35_022886 [Gossypium stocksii]|uniref:Uncharacterized protein n=1 Tax=Gossypium stocksii TaxID=47602 RepID=A0A9D4A3D2_9ROSI|nr:hypothetical protein J1N35_022886 [Gossypium stocksii]
MKEVELNEKPNETKPIKEPEVSKQGDEPNADELIEPSIDLKLTSPMPTSSNTAYWKYAKVRDDSIRNTSKSIFNYFIPEFPDYIFDSWKEDDKESEDEASKEEDDEDKSNK